MPSSAVMCADVVLYSRLMGIDEEGTEYRGRTLRAVGDALPVEFNSVADAVRAQSRCKTKCSSRRLRLRHREAGRRSLSEHRV